MSDIIMKEIERLGDPRRVFLGGLSQGCAVTLATFLSYKKGPLGGIVGLIGVQSAEDQYDKIDLDMKRKTPILLYNGEEDT